MTMLKKVDRFEQRSIFISHVHSDRPIVDALQALVKRAFSGLVEVFASSSGYLTPEAVLADVDESTLSDQFSQVLSQARQLLRQSGITARKTPLSG